MPILKGYMPFSISNESYKDEKIESVQKKMFRAQPQPSAPAPTPASKQLSECRFVFLIIIAFDRYAERHISFKNWHISLCKHFHLISLHYKMERWWFLFFKSHLTNVSLGGIWEQVRFWYGKWHLKEKVSRILILDAAPMLASLEMPSFLQWS